jgi:hypothetical protein
MAGFTPRPLYPKKNPGVIEYDTGVLQIRSEGFGEKYLAEARNRTPPRSEHIPVTTNSKQPSGFSVVSVA